jgi:hypothetical protein
MGSERICAFGKKVGSMRRSDWCSSICKRQHDFEKRKEKLKGSRITTFVLVHHCIRPELQMGETPDPLTCGCREEMSAEDLKARTSSAEIRRSIWPNSRRCRCPSASNASRLWLQILGLRKESRSSV